MVNTKKLDPIFKEIAQILDNHKISPEEFDTLLIALEELNKKRAK